PGYDLTTGLGSPISGQIVSDLSGVPIYHSNALVAVAPSQSQPASNPSAVAMAPPLTAEGSSAHARGGIETTSHTAAAGLSKPVPIGIALDPTAPSSPTAATTTTTGPRDHSWRMSGCP